MAHIEVKRGLDIPIAGRPDPKSTEITALKKPQSVALNLDPFEETRFKLLAKAGSVVKKGEPLVFDKALEERVFVSPGAGLVKEVRRGLKRRLLDIVVELADNEETVNHGTLNPATASRADILSHLLKGGAFPHIRKRPFDTLANPNKEPRSIFVRAIESAPLVPPAELQVEGHEDAFQTGLDTLAKLTKGKVHLVHRTGSPCKAFTDAKNVVVHTVEGPHPAANASLHIERIDPILKVEDVLWTLSAYDVVVIGYLMTEGHYFTEKVIGVGGPGIIEGRSGYFRVRAGHPISEIIINRVADAPQRFVSGDPLMGSKVENEDFLGFYHFALTVIPESISRELLHFFRLGLHKYTATHTYLSGFFDNSHRDYNFTTSQHGEHRAFMDPTLYDKVMPLGVPTMQLVKAVMAGDFELAESLGLLSVTDEDFALPTFVCPSKMEMTDIIKNGLRDYHQEVIG